jgi:AcrR family transcriptional regulator
VINDKSPAPARPADHRAGPRRRGPALERAIFDAVIAELGDVGFGRLSYDRVAERAGTGKTSIYRRWPDKIDLVLDTFKYALPALAEDSLTGELRADLITVLRRMARAFSGPIGAACRGVIGEGAQHPEMVAAMREKVIEPGQQALRDVIVAAIERGQAGRHALAPECLAVGPTMLMQSHLATGAAISDGVVEDLVDKVLLPLVRPGV